MTVQYRLIEAGQSRKTQYGPSGLRRDAGADWSHETTVWRIAFQSDCIGARWVRS